MGRKPEHRFKARHRQFPKHFYCHAPLDADFERQKTIQHVVEGKCSLPFKVKEKMVSEVCRNSTFTGQRKERGTDELVYKFKSVRFDDTLLFNSESLMGSRHFYSV